MAATVKAWHRDDCRRLSIDIEQIQYQELKKKLQNTFQLDTDFTVKYADMDGDLCTITGTEEFEDLVNSDLVKERRGTLRLQVISKSGSFSSGSNSSNGSGSRRPSIFHRRDSSDHSGTSTLAGDSKTIFDSQYTDCDMLEILRDISLFICARGMDRHGEHAPTTAQNFQRLNYARAVRAKFPLSNGADLLQGLDGHVYKWSVETTGQWLNNSGYEDNVQIFKDHDITGDVLLELTHDTLKDMGMTSTGRRIRLLKMIAELRLHVADLTIQEATDEAQALEGLAIN
ncbi:Adaptor for signal transduction [Mortierella claussenii]|nr:Adaptor for signal transduction [Mortierella claussenii]